MIKINAFVTYTEMMNLERLFHAKLKNDVKISHYPPILSESKLNVD
jgi:hypothetical protein